ncbi:hypothetical protein [Bacillus marinisedimentorum]|uniref:hypothetical protein n=1 Tax=Bacillus marinisedimentorum TaxID=1821260 RepID=UPI001B804B61|nr:hypothetical protein [Bacillus marinisedimentorum]
MGGWRETWCVRRETPELWRDICDSAEPADMNGVKNQRYGAKPACYGVKPTERREKRVRARETRLARRERRLVRREKLKLWRETCGSAEPADMNGVKNQRCGAKPARYGVKPGSCRVKARPAYENRAGTPAKCGISHENRLETAKLLSAAHPGQPYIARLLPQGAGRYDRRERSKIRRETSLLWRETDRTA